MDTLHSETLDFLVQAMKAKHQQSAGAKSPAQRTTRKAEIENLRKRITLEFHYLTQTKGAGDSPK